MDKKQKIIEIMGTKEKGSRMFNKLQNRLIKQMKKEQYKRENEAREYSLALSKIFKNKLLEMIN
jgi:hypothetical protein